MSAADVEKLLIELLADNGFYDVVSFREAQVLTTNKGVVATTLYGAEFQITIVRSR